MKKCLSFHFYSNILVPLRISYLLFSSLFTSTRIYWQNIATRLTGRYGTRNSLQLAKNWIYLDWNFPSEDQELFYFRCSLNIVNTGGNRQFWSSVVFLLCFQVCWSCSDKFLRHLKISMTFKRKRVKSFKFQVNF